jgi:diguanylate cyclase (GGDEF)-like protein/PAS domain S-box-containing protein
MPEQLSRKPAIAPSPAYLVQGKLHAVSDNTPEAIADKRAGGERRNPQRSGAQASYSKRPAAARRVHNRLAYRKRSMAVFLLGAYAVAAIAAGGVPDSAVIVPAALSVLLVLADSFLTPLKRRAEASSVLRSGMVLLTIVVPMAGLGFALSHWVLEGLAMQWAIATLICAGAASAAVYEGRIVPLFASKIAMWSAFALIEISAVVLAAMVTAGLTLLLIARLEWATAEKRRLEREARERVAARAEDILRSFEESGQGWFWETDRRGLITYISPKAAALLGKSSEELQGRPLSEIVDTAAGAAEAERTLAFHLSARSPFQDIELRAATGADDERWWALTGRPVYDSFENFVGFRGHGTDLTEKRRSDRQVSRLAHYDSLTGLANRVQMGQVLEQILAAPSERERACAVLMLDLDRFKQVNDTLGHPAGDALLKQVAQRLERALDGSGRCGRLGGDEFEAIVPGYQSREQLSNIASEIIYSLSQPYSIEGQSVVIGASVGIALAPEHGITSDALIRNVDLALYAAKDAGRGCYRFYAEDLHAAAEERAELEQDLREAIARGDMQLFYQPVVYSANEKIVGFEAVMRWEHPKRGWLSPAKFIPIAEDAGLIDQLGQWALRTACADLATWPEQLSCAVNVSPLQFSNPELPTIVANALAHSRINPSRLELEITESVFLNDNAGTDAMFKALKRVGVRLALDDFGTGYSSLGYLKKAPFDKIKIDSSFVRGATEEGSRNGAIISSITSLAEALRMDTTAEGVETLDELELVRLLGCSHVQGFIYYKPMSAAAISELVSGDMIAQAEGPQSARNPRQVLLRRVTVLYNGNRLDATLRNISESGAMIEGLWNVPVGSLVQIVLSAEKTIAAQVRWSRENRLGVGFSAPLKRRADGTFSVLRG